MKIKILALCAGLAAACTVAACSFGPDAYNGPPVCPGDPPPDTVMVPEGECWDGGLPPDAGTAGGDTAGGAGTAGASTAGTGGASTAGTGGGSTAGTGG